MRELPILIVAGHFDQAATWAIGAGLSRKDWHYVAGERDILGRRGNRIVFVGEWWESQMMIRFSRKDLCALYGFENIEGQE